MFEAFHLQILHVLILVTEFRSARGLHEFARMHRGAYLDVYTVVNLDNPPEDEDPLDQVGKLPHISNPL